MNKQKKIIVFSGKQFSGKDTVAKILLKKFSNLKRMGIADAIKMRYSQKTGLSVAEIEKNKSVYRADLIELGNWGRSQNQDFWLYSILDSVCDVVVTDIRMKHELDVFKREGAITVRVEADEKVRSQRGKLASKDDDTETQLDNIKDWDFVIKNNGSYDELEQNTSVLINELERVFKLNR